MRWLTAIVMVLLLTACGGGGSGPSALPTPDYSGNAAAAKLTSTVNLSANTVLLSWNDTFPAGASYRVESQNPDASYSLLEAVTGASGAGAAMQWQRAVTVSTIYRVVGVFNGATVTLLTPQGQSTVSVNVASTRPDIVIDKIEPVTGAVQLSLSGAIAYPSVSWYADLHMFDVGVGIGNPVTLNTATMTNGSHLILAKIQVATDSFIEVRRSISVSNSNIAIKAVLSGTTGTVNVDVTATSSSGINTVSATLDGVFLSNLASPNACSTGTGCGSGNDIFRFSVSPASGTHAILITATDGAGTSKSVTVQVPISNLPGLTLASPIDGAFVSGTLALSGNYSTDRPGTVTVVASLGDYQFMSSTSQSFSGSMSLAGLSPGAYTLTVRATDSANGVTMIQRTITVTLNPTTTYTPLFTLGANGHLLAVEGNLVLYSAEDAGVRLRDVANNQEVTLKDASSIAYQTDWQISNGYTYAQGKGSDCVITFVCIYQWSATGLRTNLTTNNPFIRSYEEHPVAHANYVIWANSAGANPGSYTLFDVSKGSYTKINQPAGANYIGNTNFDFAVQGNVINFYYWAQTGGEGMTSSFDVYKWSSDTQASTRLTPGGARNVYPITDGQQVAWLQTAIGGSGANTLLALPVSGGVTSTLSTNTNESFQLRDGTLTWLESTSTTKALKALVNGNTSTISSTSSAVLYGTGGGYIVFGEMGKTYSWNAATKMPTLRIDSAPNQVLMTGNSLYFVMGVSQSVYRVLLN